MMWPWRRWYDKGHLDGSRVAAAAYAEGYHDRRTEVEPLILAGLRAKVLALHPDWLGTPADVLALLDEVSK